MGSFKECKDLDCLCSANRWLAIPKKVSHCQGHALITHVLTLRCQPVLPLCIRFQGWYTTAVVAGSQDPLFAKHNTTVLHVSSAQAAESTNAAILPRAGN